MFQVTLFTKDPSNRPYVLILNIYTQTFLKIKISNIDEIIGYKHKDIKNEFFIFKTDCSIALKEAKKARSNKSLQSNLKHFTDYSLLWNLAPEEVKYEYKKLLTSYGTFRFFNDQSENRPIQDSSKEISLNNCQAENKNIGMLVPMNLGPTPDNVFMSGMEDFSGIGLTDLNSFELFREADEMASSSNSFSFHAENSYLNLLDLDDSILSNTEPANKNLN